ncbi:MAG: HAD-IB family phosphatase [Clostridiaceae bacterium]|jgi:2-hydroxy-3-keto-5-methylthiopentenyl-1-phosphate phosphatase|nr:HAD-IB family phosphatase [Clostridiaceae bacterium]
MLDRILFIDFDGTITSEETLTGAMRLCIPADMIREKEKEMLEGKRSLADTLHLAFSMIPGNRLEDILAYVRDVPIRPGFEALLDLAGEEGIPVVVISGGLKPYVEEKLAPYREKILDIYSVDISPEEDQIRLLSPYEGQGDLMQKTDIMALYDYKEAIMVGDGHTDVRMALASDLVFARDSLAGILTDKGIPFLPWQDFYDVMEAIKSSR